jgi:hypothetical protein
MFRQTFGLTAASALALTVGCATAPTKQHTETQAAVRSAEEVGAQKHPKSAFHLKLAHEQLQIAQRLMDDEGDDDMEEAYLILVRAENDAELAMAYARTAEAREEADEAWMKVRELQRESDVAQFDADEATPPAETETNPMGSEEGQQ